MINWREIPFIRLVIPCIFGALLFSFLEKDIRFVLGFLIIVLCLSLFRYLRRAIPHARRWEFGFWTFLLIFLMTGYRFISVQNLIHKNNFCKSITHPEAILAKWDCLPVLKGKWLRGKANVLYQRDSLGQWKKTKGNIQLYLEYSEKNKLEFSFGDGILLNSTPQKIPSVKNPKAFDYRSYLWLKKIDHQAFVKDGEWQPLREVTRGGVLRKSSRLRSWFLFILETYIKDQKALGVAQALVLGYKENLDRTLKKQYAETGAMHVLAVSGLHVGLVSFLLHFILEALRFKGRRWKVLKTITTILGIWSFALITGASPSVLRAACMFSFIILGVSLNRFTNIYNTLAASAFLLLLLDPLLLFSVGFQLSYTAVLGIVFFQARIARLWIIKNKLLDYFWQLFCVSLAAQLATLPLGLYYFHQLPLFFWLSGLIVVPAAALILIAGLLLIALHAIFPPAAHGLGWLLDLVLKVVNYSIELINNIPFGLLKGIWVTEWMAILLYAAIILFALFLLTKQKRWIYGMLISLVSLSMMNAYRKVHQLHQKKVVFYHSSKDYLIDVFNGRSNYSLASKDLEELNKEYCRQNYRWFCRVRDGKEYDLLGQLKTKVLFYQKGLFQFYDKTFLILHSRNIDQLPLGNLHVDYLYICGSLNISIEDLMEQVSANQLIWNSDTARKKSFEWSKYARRKGLNYYDISQNGALIINLHNAGKS